MKDYILETCVDSVESAMAAAEGGADRLELCSNLIIGGTTPGPWLFEEIRKRSDIRIHALIRPRFGDFCYTDAEFSMIRNAVKDFRKMGAEGVVVGILKPDGTLNMEQMKELMDAAGDMSVTLHRAFDVCADPIEAMEQAISFKICSVGSFSSSRNARICFPSAVSSDAFTVLPSSFLRVNSGMEIFSSMSSRFAFRNASSTLFISPI